MAGVNETRIVLTAEDRTSPALASVTRGLGGMQAEAMRASSALGAIGFTAAAAGAMGYVRSIINTADETQKLSQRIGIATKDIAGWKLAADLSGASLESVAKGIKGLSTYSAEYGDTLRQVGIDTQDPQRALIQLADLFAAMPDDMEKTALATKLFGKAGLDLLPMLNQGSAELEKLRGKAEEYGRKLAELGPDAEKFNDQMEEFAFNSKLAGANIAAYFLPGLEGLSRWLVDITQGGDKARAALEWITGSREGMLGRSQGYKGPVNAFGLPATPEDIAAMNAPAARTPEQEAAAARARKLLAGAAGAGGSKGKAAAYKRDFDPEGDLEYARFEREFQEGKKRAIASGQETEKQIEAQERLRKKYVEMADPLQKYRVELDEIATLRAAGLLTAEQAIEAEWKVNEQLDVTAKKMLGIEEAGKDMFAGLTDAVEAWGNKAADTFADFVVDGKASFSDLANSILKDIVRIQAKSVLDPITKGASGFLSSGIGKLFDGFFSGGGSPAASQGFGMAGDAGSLLGFAGGGYTGNGARSGGMDGQGGFLAMLHPQESVIDHAQGGSGGGVTVVQNLNFSVGVAQTVRAEVMNMMPQIQAAAQGAMVEARLRGATRAAYRG